MLNPDFIPHLIGVLFKLDDDKIDQRVMNLISKNADVGGDPRGFLFRGEFWTFMPPKERARIPKKVLHPDLHAEGTEIHMEKQRIIKEKKQLTSGLGQLLRDCSTEQDVRDALPETATLILPQLGQMQRTRPEAYTIASRPLLKANWDMICDVFAFYIGNRLLG